VSEAIRKKKLIEVALPLDEINAACKADKDRKTGTLRNIHKWWAPMPLPAWRALLFAALIDDPEDDNQRVYLLDLVKRLVSKGADIPDDIDLEEARRLLKGQFPEGVPIVVDPFCGGGSTLVEAQRLGLPSFGSDLNPVAALISRALTELAPKVWDRMALHPPSQDDGLGGLWREVQQHASGLHGLELDLRYYAQLVSERAWKSLRNDYGPGADDVLTWTWVRTGTCCNPACQAEVPLTTSWWLSKRQGDLAWMQPSYEGAALHINVFAGRSRGEAPEPTKVGRGANFNCPKCGALLNESAVMAQGRKGNLGLRLAAVSEEGSRRRTYRAPTFADAHAASEVAVPDGIPNVPQPDIPRWFSGPRFGLRMFADLYTPRQLKTLGVHADVIAALRDEIVQDGGSEAWADAVVTFLGLGLGRMAQYQSSQVRWFIDSRSGGGQPLPAFGRHDIPMQWDFAELTPRVGAGSLPGAINSMVASFKYLVKGNGQVVRADARSTQADRAGLVATDPPYFDAIGYADLSDYFYMWHRRALRAVHPDLFATIAAPKTGELTAIPSHHGKSAERARDYFVDGFTETFHNLRASSADGLPMLIVYASKEQKGGREEETRWSSILAAIVNAELEITGTWPIHGTGGKRMIGIGTNAVAAYIVMVCRPRSPQASTCSLADFNRALRRELGSAVRDLQAASILPVDLAQAAMGPGMEIYSRYRAVVNQSGQAVPVDQALRLINAALGEVLDEQEGELDPASRFAVRWWATHGWNAAAFGEADKAVRPLGITVDDVKRAQVATAAGNKVQLLGRQGLDRTWAPSKDARPTAWEAVHHLADRLIDGGGELEAARLIAVLGNLQDSAMALVYRLHDIAAKAGRTADQERYNALISSWVELVRLGGDSQATAEGLF
jgi:putative DNA methylase